jgi:hypothetical protein
MSRKRRNLEISMDSLRVAALHAHASHEYSQQVLHDTRIRVGKLQQQLLDLQHQLNTLNQQLVISRKRERVLARSMWLN